LKFTGERYMPGQNDQQIEDDYSEMYKFIYAFTVQINASSFTF